MITQYQATRYDAASLRVGIVHLGLGAFMRAHLAVYTEQVLNRRPGDWGICAANIRSNAGIVAVLNKQHGCYHTAEYRNSAQATLRQVSCLREAVFAASAEQSRALIERLQDPLIKIVTLTVTEKGYYLNPANGQLLRDHEQIQHDLAQPQAPATAIGILVAALAERQRRGIAAPTLLSCDNMPNNGKTLKAALLQFAALVQPALVPWIEKEVSCPCSMVDRIVPAMTPDKLEEVNVRLALNGVGYDQAAVACEEFSQWVIEDEFPQGRPQWELAGAQFVADVAPFETMKLRLLNGSHSLLAYLGSLGKYEYVSDCMNDADYVALIRHYMWREAMPTLTMPQGVDLSAYAESLLQRFANDSLRHRTRQIAMDGSMKIPQRWLQGIQHQLDHGVTPVVGALGLATWLRYLTGLDEDGFGYKVDDPQATALQAVSSQHADIDARVRALLQTPVFAGTRVLEHPAFVSAITAYYRQLLQHGARATVADVVAKLEAATSTDTSASPG